MKLDALGSCEALMFTYSILIFHWWCASREDIAMWIKALQSALDPFLRALTSRNLVTSEDIVVSIEKL